MLECVANVSEGRNVAVLEVLAGSCGDSLLDLHRDVDHHRSVFTLAGPQDPDAAGAARALARVAVRRLDLRTHAGVHPRLGVLDVVPFVSLDGRRGIAIEAAHDFARWLVEDLGVPVFLYDDADPERRSLPDARRDAFVTRDPDLGPVAPHPSAGATAVGARPPLVALNCVLDRHDLALARGVAARVRERDGGLPGVRALGFELASAGTVQVSLNLTDLDSTGIEAACTEVRRLVEQGNASVERVEVVGLIPMFELARCSAAFRSWADLGDELTIEARLGRAR